jgi:hypothetical protein
MKTKQYRVPLVSGYFSNVSTIAKLAVLHDAPIDDEKMQLQRDFNDLYQVFMHRFSEYALTDTAKNGEEDKLAGIFLELVKIKRALRDEPSIEAEAK